MTNTSLILAAHGGGAGSAANRRLCRIADHLQRRSYFRRVRAAFHLGEPKFADVVRELDDEAEVVVLPVMTSAGYFSRIVLPRALADGHASPARRLHVLPPLGTHADVPGIVARQLAETAARFALPRDDTTVLIVGHGTPRIRESAAAALRVAGELRARDEWAAVQAAFLDDEPRLEDVPGRLTTGHVLVYPFLIGGGEHTLVDIPQRLGGTIPAGARLPAWLRNCERRIVLARPFGLTRALLELVGRVVAPLRDVNPDHAVTREAKR